MVNQAIKSAFFSSLSPQTSYFWCMGSPTFFSNLLSSLIALAGVIFFTVFSIFAFLLISYFLVICEVLLSWILDHGRPQRDVEAGETIHLRRSDNEVFIEDYNVHDDNVPSMQIFWMQVLGRFRLEYLIEEEEEQTQRVLNMLPPPVKYKSQEGLSGCDECVICLEDFVDGDSCRVFPVCKHNFHLDCLDRWLKNGQANCPICRQGVVDACAKT